MLTMWHVCSRVSMKSRGELPKPPGTDRMRKMEVGIRTLAPSTNTPPLHLTTFHFQPPHPHPPPNNKKMIP